ncbi:MAG: alpha/beta hydrolase family protein [Candidatus Thorarchaeota archaeon]
MRILELVIIGLLCVLGIQFFLPERIANRARRELMGWFGVLDLLLILAHAFIEGSRWQMIPVYLLSSVVFVYSVFQLKDHYKPSTPDMPSLSGKTRKLAFTSLALLVIVVGTTVSLDLIFPVFTLPNPTGVYTVGTATFELTDDGREEVFTALSGDHRRILVQAWYPADAVTDLDPVPYIENPQLFGMGIEYSFGFPSFMVSHLPLIKTHSYRGVPLSTQATNYPVVLFSHGYGGLIMQNTILMEEMASHGYIVFSINHPYESAVSIFPDGSVIFELPPPSGHQINDSLAVWADDSQFLLDQLAISNNDNIPDIFWSGLDFDRIGAMGHSFGGTTAEELCLIDARVKTGISFDSPHFGLSLEQNMTKPFMLLFGPDYGNPALNDTVYLRAENTCYGLYVNGTRHYNFADVCIWSPVLQSIGLTGNIDGYRMIELQNNYVRAFFDAQFKSMDSPLLTESSTQYPEVMFYWNGL